MAKLFSNTNGSGRQAIVVFVVEGKRQRSLATINLRMDALLGEVLAVSVNDDPAKSSFDIFIRREQWHELEIGRNADGLPVIHMPNKA